MFQVTGILTILSHIKHTMQQQCCNLCLCDSLSSCFTSHLHEFARNPSMHALNVGGKKSTRANMKDKPVTKQHVTAVRSQLSNKYNKGEEHLCIVNMRIMSQGIKCYSRHRSSLLLPANVYFSFTNHTPVSVNICNFKLRFK